MLLEWCIFCTIWLMTSLHVIRILSKQQCYFWHPGPRINSDRLMQCIIDILWPSGECMRRWTRSRLVHVILCRLIGSKPLPKPMLTYCQPIHMPCLLKTLTCNSYYAGCMENAASIWSSKETCCQWMLLTTDELATPGLTRAVTQISYISEMIRYAG